MVTTQSLLDMGASVCVISDSVPWLKGTTLNKPQQTLRGPGVTKFKVMGTFIASMKYRQNKVQKLTYVIQNQPCSLLSKKLCVKLGLVKLNDVEVLQSPPDFRKEFPTLFEGLDRKLKFEHHQKLRHDATPVCLYNQLINFS